MPLSSRNTKVWAKLSSDRKTEARTVSTWCKLSQATKNGVRYVPTCHKLSLAVENGSAVVLRARNPSLLTVKLEYVSSAKLKPKSKTGLVIEKQM